MLDRRATRLEQCGEHMRPRIEALRWQPKTEPVEADDEAAT